MISLLTCGICRIILLSFRILKDCLVILMPCQLGQLLENAVQFLFLLLFYLLNLLDTEGYVLKSTSMRSTSLSHSTFALLLVYILKQSHQTQTTFDDYVSFRTDPFYCYEICLFISKNTPCLKVYFV